MIRAGKLRGLRRQRNLDDRTEPAAVPPTLYAPVLADGLPVQARAFVRAHARKDFDCVTITENLQSIVVAATEQHRSIWRN
jgi:hypothetical protein